MGIARNGEIPEIEVDGKRFEVKQSHPRTAENARNGGSGQLVKLDMGLAGKSGNSPGSGSSLESVRRGLKMRFRQ